MSRVLLTALSCFILGSGIVWSGEERPNAAKNLQGKWRGTTLKINNVEAAVEDAKAFQVTMKGDEMILMTCRGDRCIERKKTFRIDPTKTPMEIDLTSLDGAEKGQTQLGIFSMEEGRWKLCVPFSGGGRPTTFKTKVDDGLMVIELERVE